MGLKLGCFFSSRQFVYVMCGITFKEKSALARQRQLP